MKGKSVPFIGTLFIVGLSSSWSGIAKGGHNPPPPPPPSFSISHGTDWALAASSGGGQDLGAALALKTDLSGNVTSIIQGGTINQGASNASIAAVQYDGSFSPDASFGGAGYFISPIAARNEANGMVLDASGNLVLAGFQSNGVTSKGVTKYTSDVLVMRVKPNGTLDTSFHGTGYYDADLATGASDQANAVAMDGTKIVIAGDALNSSGANDRMLVARFTSAGALDTTFGGGSGKLQLPSLSGTGGDMANALIVEANHEVVLAGQSNNRICVAKVKADGSGLDSLYGIAGSTCVPSSLGGLTQQNAYSAVQDGLGNVVVVGQAYDGGGIYGGGTVGVLVRFNALGILDVTFNVGSLSPGGPGFIVLRPVAAELLGVERSIILDGSGNYVAGGYSSDGTNEYMTLSTVDSLGNIVSSVSNIVIPGEAVNQAQSIVLAPSGHIYLGGQSASYVGGNLSPFAFSATMY